MISVEMEPIGRNGETFKPIIMIMLKYDSYYLIYVVVVKINVGTTGKTVH